MADHFSLQLFGHPSHQAASLKNSQHSGWAWTSIFYRAKRNQCHRRLPNMFSCRCVDRHCLQAGNGSLFLSRLSPGCSSTSSSWTDTDWSGRVLTVPNGFSQELFEKIRSLDIKFQEFSCLLMSVGLWNRQSTAILTVWLWCLLCRGGCSRSVCRRWFPSEKNVTFNSCDC